MRPTRKKTDSGFNTTVLGHGKGFPSHPAVQWAPPTPSWSSSCCGGDERLLGRWKGSWCSLFSSPSPSPPHMPHFHDWQVTLRHRWVSSMLEELRIIKQQRFLLVLPKFLASFLSYGLSVGSKKYLSSLEWLWACSWLYSTARNKSLRYNEGKLEIPDVEMTIMRQTMYYKRVNCTPSERDVVIIQHKESHMAGFT